MDKGKSGDEKSNDSVIIFDGKEPNRAANRSDRLRRRSVGNSVKIGSRSARWPV